jgi:hypothetical protein
MTCIQRRCLGVFLLYLYECSRVVVVVGVLAWLGLAWLGVFVLCPLFKKAEVKRGSSSLTL